MQKGLKLGWRGTEEFVHSIVSSKLNIQKFTN